MLPPLGSEPRTSDFTALHATIWANSPICWKSQTFRSLCSHSLLNLGLRNIFESTQHENSIVLFSKTKLNQARHECTHLLRIGYALSAVTWPLRLGSNSWNFDFTGNNLKHGEVKEFYMLVRDLTLNQFSSEWHDYLKEIMWVFLFRYRKN